MPFRGGVLSLLVIPDNAEILERTHRGPRFDLAEWDMCLFFGDFLYSGPCCRVFQDMIAHERPKQRKRETHAARDRISTSVAFEKTAGAAASDASLPRTKVAMRIVPAAPEMYW